MQKTFVHPSYSDLDNSMGKIPNKLTAVGLKYVHFFLLSALYLCITTHSREEHKLTKPELNTVMIALKLCMCSDLDVSLHV